MMYRPLSRQNCNTTAAAIPSIRAPVRYAGQRGGGCGATGGWPTCQPRIGQRAQPHAMLRVRRLGQGASFAPIRGWPRSVPVRTAFAVGYFLSPFGLVMRLWVPEMKKLQASRRADGRPPKAMACPTQQRSRNRASALPAAGLPTRRRRRTTITCATSARANLAKQRGNGAAVVLRLFQGFGFAVDGSVAYGAGGPEVLPG